MTAGRTQCRKVDPEFGEKTGSCLRDLSGFLTEHDVFVLREKFGDVHAKTAGKVVVANSGRSKFACLAGEGAISRPVFERNGNDAVEHLYHCRRCKPEIPMSPIPDHGYQPCLGQLGEMRTGGLRRNPRRKGKLARGQGTAIEKRGEHRGPRRLPDQRRYLGDERAGNHFCYIAPDLVGEGGRTVRRRSNRSGRIQSESLHCSLTKRALRVHRT
jgi:hypothetical protein